MLFLHCCFLSKLAQPEMDLRESLVLLLVWYKNGGFRVVVVNEWLNYDGLVVIL